MLSVVMTSTARLSAGAPVAGVAMTSSARQGVLDVLGEVGTQYGLATDQLIRSVPRAAASLMIRFHSSVVMVPCPCVGPASA
ncbi:hypothetical protein [Streptomyces sp. NPDC090135]|uniref:hypothetical protein n=1 Tax=Streptomyces sp. NPDC090135 TaxID=3365957 RepID=UPI0038060E06